MQAAGRLERRLGFAQPVGQARDERRRHAQVALDARRLDRDRLERTLAADTARRGRVEAPREPGRIEARRVELDRVRREIVGQARARRPQPFGEREPERQLLVVARRAHRDGHRRAADADLERLLDGDDILGVAVREANDIRPSRSNTAARVTTQVSSPRAGGGRRLRCARARARVAPPAEPRPDRAPRGAGQPRDRGNRPLSSGARRRRATAC